MKKFITGLTFFFCFASPAKADIQAGLAWLKSQQNSDGSWGRTLKETSEAFRTLATLNDTGEAWQKAKTWLSQTEPERLEDIACLLATGGSGSLEINYPFFQEAILALRDDKLFKYDVNFKGTVWHTMNALISLHRSGYYDRNLFGTLLLEIMNTQISDGSWRLYPQGGGNLIATAKGVEVLYEFRDWGIPAEKIEKAISWILARQNPDGGFGENGSTVYETSVCWQVLRDLERNWQARLAAAQYLVSTQSPNGGWNGSALETALALRALGKTGIPNLVARESLIECPNPSYSGSTVTVRAGIVNSGDASVDSASVHIYDGNDRIDDSRVFNIQPEDTAYASVSWQVPAGTRLHTLRIVADPDNQVLEINEYDNSAAREVAVSDTIKPDTAIVWLAGGYISPNGDGVMDTAEIWINISEPCWIKVEINDTSGGLVRQVVNAQYEPGMAKIPWDGRNVSGKVVADGEYVVKTDVVDTDGNTIIRQHQLTVDNNRNCLLDGRRGWFRVLKDSLHIPQYTYPYESGFLVSPNEDRIFLTIDPIWDDTCHYPVYAQTDIATLRYDGSGFRYLTEDTLYQRRMDVSLDGKRLAYTEAQGCYGPERLCIYDLPSGVKNVFAEEPELGPYIGYGIIRPQWSNKGDLLYIRRHYSPPDFTEPQLWIVPAGDTAQIMLSDTFHYGVNSAQWSPSGDWIMYNQEGMRLVSRDGLTRMELEGTEGHCWRPTDDQVGYIVERDNENSEVWLADAAGMGKRLLFNIPNSDEYNLVYTLQWSPDGRYLIASACDDWNNSYMELYVHDLIAGNTIYQKIQVPELHKPYVVPSPDSRKIYIGFEWIPAKMTNNNVIPPIKRKGDEIPVIYDNNDDIIDLKTLIRNNRSKGVDGREAVIDLSEGVVYSFTPIEAKYWSHDSRLLLTSGIDVYDIRGNPVTTILPDTIGADEFYLSKDMTDITFITYTGMTDFYDVIGKAFTLNNLHVEIAGVVRSQANSDAALVIGTVTDRNLEGYKLEYGPGEEPDEWRLIEEGNREVEDDTLAVWIPEQTGYYTLRLTAWDKAGNVDRTTKTVYWVCNPVVANVKVRPKFISPNGDGIQDTTVISYTLVKPEATSFSFYDFHGFLAKTVTMAPDSLGPHSFGWDGKDNCGMVLPEGISRMVVEGSRHAICIDTTKPHSLISGSPVVIKQSNNSIKGAAYYLSWIADDRNFREVRVDYGDGPEPNQWSTIVESTRPRGGLLLDSTVVYGKYAFQLTSSDMAGNVSSAIFTTRDSLLGLEPKEWPEYKGPAGDTVSIPVLAFASGFRPDSVKINFIPDTSGGYWNHKGPLPELPGLRQFYGDTLRLQVAKDTVKYHYYFSGWLGDSLTLTKVDSFVVIPINNNNGNNGIIWYSVRVNGTSDTVAIITIRYRGLSPDTNNLEYRTRTVVYQPPDTPQVIYGPCQPVNAMQLASSPDSILYTWNIKDIPDSTYQLFARTIDLNTLVEYVDSCLFSIDSKPFIVVTCPKYSPLQKVPLIFTGIVPIKAEAWPSPRTILRGGRIEKVAFEPGGDDFTGPYEIDWDSRTEYPNEDLVRVVQATAWDNFNNICQSSSSPFGINNRPPEAAMAYPAPGQTISQDTITIIGTANDRFFVRYRLDYRRTDGGVWTTISDRLFKRDTVKKNEPLGFWRTGSLVSGDYVLKLTTYDYHHYSVDTVQVTLQIDNPYPEAMIYWPSSGDYLRETVPVSGIARDVNLWHWNLRFGQQTLASDSQNISGLFANWNTRGVKDTTAFLILEAEDIGGLKSCDSFQVTVDNTYPNCLISLTDSSYITKPMPINGIASDTNLSFYILELGAGDQPAAWTQLGWGSQPIKGGPLGGLARYHLSNGWHTLRLTVEDLAGNVSQLRRLVNIDTIPPAPPTGLQARCVGRAVSLNWNPNNEPDMAGYHVYQNGCRADADSPVVAVSSYLDTNIICDGWYVYQVTAYDRAKLESKKSQKDSVYMDITRPFVSIGQPASGATIHGMTEITGSASDRNFKLYRLELRPASDTAAWSQLAVSQLPVSYGLLDYLNTLLLENDSCYVIRLTAEDLYGNSDTAEVLVRVDNAPPVAPAGLAAEAFHDTVRLTWEPNTEPDLAGYLAYRGSEPVSPLVPAGINQYLDNPVPDGLHTYYLIALDSAGNRSQPSLPAQVTLDNRWPAAFIIEPAPGARVSGTVAVRAWAEDLDITEVVFQFKGAGSSNWNTLGVDSLMPYKAIWTTEGLEFGDYDLRAVATDMAGHTDSIPSTTRVRMVSDNQPPAAPTGLSARGRADTVFISWLANQEPDLKGYNVYIDGIKKNSQPLASLNFNTTGYDLGYPRCRVSAVDTVGNESPLSDIAVADMMPPELTINHPMSNDGLRGMVEVRGTAIDSSIAWYIIEWGAGEAPTSWVSLGGDTTDITNGILASWNTEGLNGVHALRLRAEDKSGYQNQLMVTPLWLDNQAPPPPTVTVIGDSVWADSVLVDVTLDQSDPDQANLKLFSSEQYLTGYLQTGEMGDGLQIGGWTWRFRVGDLMPFTTTYFKAQALDGMGNASNYSNVDSIRLGYRNCDLIVYSDSIEAFPPLIVQGDTVVVRIAVVNSGEIPVRNIPLRVFAADSNHYQNIGEVIIAGPIMPGGSGEALVFWDTYGWMGPITLLAEANHERTIYETDYQNNTGWKNVLVRYTHFEGRLALSPDTLSPHQIMNVEITTRNCGSQFDTVDLSLLIEDSTGTILHLTSLGDTSNIFDLGHWVDDSLPQADSIYGEWIWDSTRVMRGSVSHKSQPGPGIKEHGFVGAGDTLEVLSAQSIVQYIYLDPDNRPQEVMLEFLTADSSREYRAYWGANLIERGHNNTWSRKRMGDLPSAGRWVRLEVPARDLGLEGRKLTGLSYILFDGSANWDNTCIGIRRYQAALDQGDSLVLFPVWYHDNLSSGRYRIRMDLIDGSINQRLYAPFVIRGIPGLVANLATGQANYTAGQTVGFEARLDNNSPNLTYRNVVQKLQVLDSTGNCRYDTTWTVSTINPGGMNLTTLDWQSGTDMAGNYRAYLLASAINGDTLAVDSCRFSFTPPSGGTINLRGVCGAAPRLVTWPESFGIYWNLTNIGQAAADTSVLKLSLADPDSGYPLITFVDTILALSPGEARGDTHAVSTQPLAPGSYPIRLELMRPDTILLLAYGGVTVNALTAPVISEAEPHSGAHVRGTVAISARVSSAAAAVDSVVANFDTIRLPLLRLSGDSLNGLYGTLYPSLGMVDGLHHLVFAAWDRAGRAALPIDNEITVDNTAPVITVSGVSAGGWYPGSVTPVVAIAEANPESISVTLNGAPYVSGTAVSEEGRYTLNVYCRDLAGNTSAQTVPFAIDTTSPIIGFSGVADGRLYNHSVAPIISITEAHLDSQQITLNGQPYFSGTTITAEGRYELSVWAKDSAGNATASSVHFGIDTTPPPPPLMTNPAENDTVAASPVAVSGLAEAGCLVTMSLAGQTYQVYTLTTGAFQFPEVNLGQGLNIMSFTATDSAGNVSLAEVYHVFLVTGGNPQVSSRMGIRTYARILCLVPEGKESGIIGQQGADDRRFVEKSLENTGIYYCIVDNSDDFLAEMRKGRYNLYLLFRHTNTCMDRGHEEIRERVNRGDGLIVAGDHYLENIKLNDVLGVKFGGALPERDYQLVWSQSPISQPDTMAYHGRARQATPTTGQVVGTVRLAPGDREVLMAGIDREAMSAEDMTGPTEEYGKCPPPSSWEVSVINIYGQGQTALFAFDLGDTAANFTEFKELLLHAIDYCTPETTASGAMATLPLDIKVTNPGPAGSFKTVEAVPTAVAIDTAFGSSDIGGQTVTWMYDLSLNDSMGLENWVRLPDQPGGYLITAETKALVAGSYQTMDHDSLMLTVEASGLQLIDQAIAMLDSMNLNSSNDAHRRKAKRELNEAKNRPITCRADLEAGINDLLWAIKYVRMISRDITAVRLMIDQALAVWQARWAWWTGPKDRGISSH